MAMIKQQEWNAFSALLDKSQTVLFITHVNADGDGLGSQIAFYHYLNSLGKDCRIINPTPLPHNYNIIDPERIVEVYEDTCNAWILKADLAIVFDIGDFRRVGKIGELVYKKITSVSIDHHPARKDHPFKLNLVDSSAPATGYLVWKYFQEIGYASNEMPIPVAQALYASIVTDTGSFKYQSTTPDTHIMAAQLLNCGIDGYGVQKAIYEQREISQINLLGIIISKLKFSVTGKISWSIVTQEMIDQSNGKEDDVDGMTDFIRSIKNVEVSFMILEKNDGTHRINFRSSGKYTVNDVARDFDGGGHMFAAGASVKNSTSVLIENMIMEKLSKKIKGEFDVN